MADRAKHGRDKVCPDFSVGSRVSVDKCYFDSNSHTHSETLGEGVTKEGTVTFLFHQTMKEAVQFDSDEKTVKVFMNDLTKELHVLKYFDDTVYLYHNEVKIIKGHQCLSLYAEIKDKLKKGDARFKISEVLTTDKKRLLTLMKIGIAPKLL